MKTDMPKTQIKVEGMSCTNCALGIKRRLEKDGFAEVEVDFAGGLVSFAAVDDDRLQQAKEGIARSGYRVVESDSASPKPVWTIEGKFYLALLFTVPLLIAMFLPWPLLHDPVFQLILAVPVYAVGVWHFGRSAVNSLKTGVPNMDVLIILGSSAAFAYSLYGTVNGLGHDYQFYETSASIITLVLLGNLLEHRSVKRTTSAIDELVRLQKVTAKRILLAGGDESIEQIEADRIRCGDRLLVNSGDQIPTDGTVDWGEGSVDEAMISGESVPVDKSPRQSLVGGTILTSGSIKMTATATGRQTVLAQIIEMVRNAQRDKPGMQHLADRIAAVFVPLVVLIALATFLLAHFVAGVSFQPALMRSIAVLVIACPCALGLAIPTAVVVGIGRVAKSGILIRGGSTLELLARIRRIVFDKTGTLTTGRFRIARMAVDGVDEETVKSILYSMEKHSSHPIAQSICNALTDSSVIEFTEISEQKGLGLQARDLSGNRYKIGSFATARHLTDDDSHTVYLIRNDRLIAWLDVEDEIKKDAGQVIAHMKAKGIRTALLSGDRREKCRRLAAEIGIQDVFYEKTPAEKLDLIADMTRSECTAMVGDGINDAPALARASVGISLSQATQIAIKSAQVILLNGNLSLLPRALAIAQSTLTTIRQNLFWAFFYNIIAIPVAALGWLNPMIAAASMAFSDIFVVGNSLRLRRKRL